MFQNKKSCSTNRKSCHFVEKSVQKCDRTSHTQKWAAHTHIARTVQKTCAIIRTCAPQPNIWLKVWSYYYICFDDSFNSSKLRKQFKFVVGQKQQLWPTKLFFSQVKKQNKNVIQYKKFKLWHNGNLQY